MKTAAVWGASGFVGRHLIAALQQAGWQVRALRRNTDAAPAGVEVRMLPFSAASDEMRAALQGVDAAFHCAGSPVEDAAGLAEYERASAQFAQAATASGVSVLIQLSTVAVYGAHADTETNAYVTTATPLAATTAYARSRAAAEAVARSGTAGGRTRCVVVRVPMVVGVGMAADALRLFFGTLRYGVFFHPGPRHAVLNCIGISRLCQLLVALADRPSGEAAAMLQFADNVAWVDIAQSYAQQIRRPVGRIRIPRTLASLGARILLGRKPEQGLAALANRVTYADDADKLGIGPNGGAATLSDIAAVARQFAAQICFVVASEMTVSAFLRDPIRAAAERYEVTVVANTADPGFLATLGLRANLHAVPIERKIVPWHDLCALLALFRLFRSKRFDLVHSVSPKAGLLAMLAGFLARVPVRIHTFTGQVWVTRHGFARGFLKVMDRLTALFATHVLIDSPSQREFLLAQGVTNAEKSLVLGKGSVSGVDTTRFKPDLQVRAGLRRQLGYRDDDVVFLYLGRLNRDKGMLDLAAAFARVAATSVNVHLLAVGPDEDEIRDLMLAVLGNAVAQAKFIDFTDRPQDYMAAADVFCLPSYREGFGTVVIEAAACGVPAVASRIYGLTDAVVDGVTGTLHAPGDVDALTAAMTRLAADPRRRRMLGEAARQRALSDFPMTALTSALLGFYAKILN